MEPKDLKAIKAQGGITFAQTPNSAQYGDMPQSAISAEAADFVLTPDKIAAELQKIAMNPQLARSEIAVKRRKSNKRRKAQEGNSLKRNICYAKIQLQCRFLTLQRNSRKPTYHTPHGN